MLNHLFQYHSRPYLSQQFFPTQRGPLSCRPAPQTSRIYHAPSSFFWHTALKDAWRHEAVAGRLVGFGLGVSRMRRRFLGGCSEEYAFWGLYWVNVGPMEDNKSLCWPLVRIHAGSRCSTISIKPYCQHQLGNLKTDSYIL